MLDNAFKLCPDSLNAFERSSRSDNWKYLHTIICYTRVQNHVSRTVMINCFQMHEIISINIKCISKRVYKQKAHSQGGSGTPPPPPPKKKRSARISPQVCNRLLHFSVKMAKAPSCGGGALARALCALKWWTSEPLRKKLATGLQTRFFCRPESPPSLLPNTPNPKSVCGPPLTKMSWMFVWITFVIQPMA